MVLAQTVYYYFNLLNHNENMIYENPEEVSMKERKQPIINS